MNNNTHQDIVGTYQSIKNTFEQMGNKATFIDIV